MELYFRLILSANLLFWEIPDDETYGIFLEQLAFQFDTFEHRSSELFSDLPLGYGVSRYVIRFEIHLRFSGWYAFENLGTEEVGIILSYYKKAGLTEEAEAVKKAQDAWYEAQEHGKDEHDAAGAAYKSVKNPYKDDDKRWGRILELSRNERWWKGN